VAVDRSPHVVLVGLPGTGKTSVGRRLAKELERPFADVDEQLELRAGRSIPRLFREEGEAAFRQLETQVLGDLLGHPAALVLAAGGGAVTRPENRALLRGEAGAADRADGEAGGADGAAGGAATPGGGDRRPVWVVWLRAPATFLAARTDPTHRPLLAADPAGTLARLEAERAALYAEVAHEVVDIEPFHAEHAEPKDALARHLAARLAAGNGSPTAPTADSAGRAVPGAGPSDREVAR
jgi:shikimate kinase